VRDAFPEARDRAPLRVVCVGNAFRGDDAAGLEVAKLLQGTLPRCAEVLEHEGEPSALIDSWEGAEALWLVDAVSSGAEGGAVSRLEVGEQPLPAGLFRASTHHLGLADAIELARVLGRLPARTVVYGIEGTRFEAGGGLTPKVAAALPGVAAAVRAEVCGQASAEPSRRV
jgi:hydrogenase maturation protease